MPKTSMALIGVTDPHARWFADLTVRRRAGLEIVGFSDPDPQRRAAYALRTGLPGFATHRPLLPVELAVVGAGPDTLTIADEVVRGGADVLLTRAIDLPPAELDELLDIAQSHGRRIRPIHTYRPHPASRLAKELLDADRLGRLGLASLLVPAGHDDPAGLAVEILDLVGWLTGDPGELIAQPSPATDPAREYGELVIAFVPTSGVGVGVEVRRHDDLSVPVLQVVGELGTIEWNLRTGELASLLGDEPAVTVAPGPPSGQAEWILEHLIRSRDRSSSEADPWRATRLVTAQRHRFGW